LGYHVRRVEHVPGTRQQRAAAADVVRTPGARRAAGLRAGERVRVHPDVAVVSVGRNNRAAGAGELLVAAARIRAQAYAAVRGGIVSAQSQPQLSRNLTETAAVACGNLRRRKFPQFMHSGGRDWAWRARLSGQLVRQRRWPRARAAL